MSQGALQIQGRHIYVVVSPAKKCEAPRTFGSRGRCLGSEGSSVKQERGVRRSTGLLSSRNVPYSFPVRALRCPQTPQSLHHVLCNINVDRLVLGPIVEFWSGGHTSFEKATDWNEAIFRLLHANGAARHHYQDSSLRCAPVRFNFHKRLHRGM